MKEEQERVYMRNFRCWATCALVVSGLCLSDEAANVSVFGFQIADYAKSQGISVTDAARRFHAAGVRGFDCLWSDRRIDDLIAGGLQPANFFGAPGFLSADGGVATGEAFIAAALKYKVPRVMMLTDEFSGTDDEADFAKILAGARRFVDKATAKGLVVTTEDFGYYKTHQNPCGHVAYIKRLLDGVPKLQFTVDSGNLYNLEGRDAILEIARFAQRRIRHVHLKDQVAEKKGPYVTLGTGAIPNREIMELMKDIGYSSWYTLECLVGDDLLEDAKRQIGVLKEWLALPTVELPGEATPSNGQGGTPLSSYPFPDRLSAFVWRNWFVVPHDTLAAVVGASVAEIETVGIEMGLPANPEILPEWKTKGFITVIRRNWHLLPYGQLMQLLDMTRKELRFHLIEDDFLWVKLGRVKPACEPLDYDAKEIAQTRGARRKLAAILKQEGADDFSEEARFSFIREISSLSPAVAGESTDTPTFDFRLIFSYFADYVDPLGDPEIGSYPEGLLQKLAADGVNAVWLHTVLNTLVVDPKYPEFGEGAERRLANLQKLVDRAAKYGVKVYLYMNEPRAQPEAFFARNAERQAMKGASDREGLLHTMCLSTPEGRRWLGDGLCQVFSRVKGLGGIFTITASENFTSCASHDRQALCPHCRGRSRAELIAEANRIMIEGMRRGDPAAEALVWNWAWPQPESAVVEKLPKDHVRLMSVSERLMPFERGGVKGVERDYAISVIGPGDVAKNLWKAADARGIPTVAKVQANCSWEIAAFPYLPLGDLVAEHALNLVRCGVDGVMLSWSHGCCPAPNLRIFRDIRKDDPDRFAVQRRLAASLYGAEAVEPVLAAWHAYGDGYREYPFDVHVIYDGPLQWGAANPLYPKATGWRATMVGLPYDDLAHWCGEIPYPVDVWCSQLKKVADGFARGNELFKEAIRSMTGERRAFAEKELRMFRAAELHFVSCVDQANFIRARDRGDEAEMRRFAEKELASAKALLPLVRSDSRIGYESSNHYFYTPQDVREKILTVRRLPVFEAVSPEEAFAHPPAEARPCVWWHWMGGQVTESGIVRDLDWFSRIGIFSATVFGMADSCTPWAKRIGNIPTGGLHPFDERWWKLFAFACREGKKRGIDIGLHNCPGYTSTGGPWIPSRLAMRELVFNVTNAAEQISTKPNARYPVYNEDDGRFELPDCPARQTDVVEVGVARGGIRVSHIPMGSFVQPADWGSFGLECDKMNPEAVDCHLDHVFGELKRHLGDDLPAAGLKHILLDSYEAGRPNWTPRMREEFAKRRGYDPLEFLPILGGFTNLYTATEVAKFSRDVERTVKDLYRDVLFRRMAERLHAEGLAFSCEPYEGPFESREVAVFVDRLMTEFWNRPIVTLYRPDHCAFNTFLGPNGRRHNIVEAEAFTGQPQNCEWTEMPENLKKGADAAFLQGVNRLVLHTNPLQPWDDEVKPGVTMGRWGTHFGRTQTWAETGKPWYDYLARCQALLQWGEPSDKRLSLPLEFGQLARTDGARTIYFLVAQKTGCSFDGFPRGKWFDPVTGSVGGMPSSFVKGQSGFFEPDEEAPFSDDTCDGQRTLVNFTPSLGDRSKSADPSVRYFSGTQTYRTTFDLPGKVRRVSLMAATFGQVLTVRVNGRPAGTIWCAPWTTDLPTAALCERGNVLEIDVTNSWRNRLIGDEQEPPDCEFAPAPYQGGQMLVRYPDWFSGGLAARPSKGRRCFVTWQYFDKDSELSPSGLIIPPTLSWTNAPRS